MILMSGEKTPNEPSSVTVDDSEIPTTWDVVQTL